MLTFLQFVNEAQHFGKHQHWGLIHPTTGKIIPGEEHPTATGHHSLMAALHPNSVAPRYAKYATTHSTRYPEKGDINVYDIDKENKPAVLKAWDKLPHHQSNQVYAEYGQTIGKRHAAPFAGHKDKVYNQLRNHQDPIFT